MKTYKVLLAASTSWHSFARLPRLLSLADCSVDVMCPAKATVATRRFVDKRYFVKGGAKEIAKELLSYLKQEPLQYDWVILGDDELFEVVAATADNSVNYWFPSPRDEQSIKFFTSKLTFMQRCHDNGFSISPYYLCTSLEQALAAATEYGFPVVVKTAGSIGGSGVTRINSLDELVKKISTLDEIFAVQKFTLGRPISMEVLFDHGNARCWITTEIFNRWPRVLGPSTTKKLIDIPNMPQMLEKLGKITNFHGFATIDAILPYDSDVPMLCEMNPRQTTGYHFDPRVRREFAHAVTDMLKRKVFSTYTPLPVTGHKEGLFPEAFYYLTDNPRKLSSWESAFNSLQRVPIDDPMYLLQMAKDYRHFIKGKMKKTSLQKS
jgi:hypothetical protein